MSELKTFLAKYLTPEALSFVMCFNGYCHLIDDIIDEHIDDPEKIIEAFESAIHVYSHPFYQQFIPVLRPVIHLVTNSYIDSVKMERSNIAWMKQHADTLRHCNNDLILTCIDICNGPKMRREASLALRTLSYNAHKEH